MYQARLRSGPLRLAVLAVVVLSVGLGFSGRAVAASPLLWSASEAVDPGTELVGISCPTTSFCAAVEPGKVLVSTDPTGGPAAWKIASTSVGDNRLHGVSCPSPSVCVAVGPSIALTSTDPTGGPGAWNSTSFGAASAPGTAVSCPSATLCVAGGSAGQISVSHDPTAGPGAWTVSQAPVGTDFYCDKYAPGSNCDADIEAISCPSVSLCVATDSVGEVISGDPNVGAWSVTSSVTAPGTFELYATDGLDSLSCPSLSLCVTAQWDGALFVSQDPTGPASSWHSPPGQTGFGGPAGLPAVSCGSSSLCVEVDGGGAAVSTEPAVSTSAWHPVNSSPPFPTPYELEALSCASDQLCLVGGSNSQLVIGVAPPSAAKVRALLRAQLRPPGGATRIRPLIRHRGFSQRAQAISAGHLVLSWYCRLPRGRHPTPHRVLIATGQATFRSQGTKTLKVKLTTAGRHLLRSAKRIRLTANITFTVPTQPTITEAHAFTLRR